MREKRNATSLLACVSNKNSSGCDVDIIVNHVCRFGPSTMKKGTRANLTVALHMHPTEKEEPK